MCKNNNTLGIVQKIWVQLYNQMASVLENKNKNISGYCTKIICQRPELITVIKEMMSWKIVGVAVPADHKIKNKGNKWINRWREIIKEKYQDLAKEQRNLWNMNIRTECFWKCAKTIVVWFLCFNGFWFNGISTFVGHLMPKPFS